MSLEPFVSKLAVICGVMLAQVPAGPQSWPQWPAEVPANARYYVQLDVERPGRMAAWRDPDGTLQVVYQYRSTDGCFADIRSTFTLDVVGVPVWVRHTGRTCEPSRIVDEIYTRSGSLGLWRSERGRGQGDVIGKKFYTSATVVPEERAQMVRALLAAGDRLELLPEGLATVDHLEVLTVSSGSRVERVTRYRLGGLHAGPTIVWLDSRGELFALGPGFIREDWKSVSGQLRRSD